jgi:hypothetical protein
VGQPILCKCIFTRHVVSITYGFCLIVQPSFCDRFDEIIESISYSESINCGDMAKFVSNRCHTPLWPEFEYSVTLRYDETRIGFVGVEESSPPAIREKASLMESVVFVAAMCRLRVAFEAVWHNLYLLSTVSLARKISSERTLVSVSFAAFRLTFC